MGIIGIVSALTLPNLNSSTGDKERVAKVKKIYRDLNDAFGRAEAIYGPFEDWFVNDGNNTLTIQTRLGERVIEFMKTSKICKPNISAGCFSDKPLKSLSNETLVESLEGDVSYRILTADGSSVKFNGNNIVVDIDGPTSGQNTVGKDIFLFDINNSNGIAPHGQGIDFSALLSDSTGEYAAAWIIKYDNADYLKFKNAKGLCPNGTTVTEANPRCK